MIGDLYLQDPDGPCQKNALQSRDGERGDPTSNYDETDQNRSRLRTARHGPSQIPFMSGFEKTLPPCRFAKAWVWLM